MEVDAGVTRPRSGISANSEWPIVWHCVSVVVEAGCYIVGDAGIHADNRAGPEVQGKMIDADKVESMAPIIVGSPVFRAQIVVIRGKRKHSTRIVHGLRKRVLSEKVESVSQGCLQRDGETVTARPPGRFELIDVNERGICKCSASRWRRIDVPSAVQL